MTIPIRAPLRKTRLSHPNDSPIPKGWLPSYTEPWSPEDEHWLEVLLWIVQHFAGTHHDPIECDRIPHPERGRSEWILLREEAGYTGKKLAAELEVDPATVSRWESGRRWPNSPDYLRFLNDASEEHAGRMQQQLYFMWQKRDRWMEEPHNSSTPGITPADLWEILYGPSRLYDKWLDTGILPTWTPADSGLRG